MRKRNLLLMLGVLIALYSCKEEVQIDTPLITSYQTADVAYMADSIPISITATGDYPLNSIKVTFFQNNQQISESLIPTNKAGSFDKKILIPFVRDIADGPAEIQLMVKNKNFNYSTVLIPVQVTRPKFPYLTLRTAYGNYRMDPVADKDYEYAVTADFPSGKLNALIEAPAYGANGNAFLFGGETIVANATEQDSIPFQKVGSTYFTVAFNTLSFAGEPFLRPAINETEFPEFTNNQSALDLDLTQNQTITFDGILDIGNWWKNPSFLSDNGDGTYQFRAISGKYRFVADQALKYFKIEPLDASGNLANFDTATKTGGVWINGGIGDQEGSAPIERLGVPSMNSNPTLWKPEKNIAMAPMGNGIYQVKFVANQTMFLSNVSGSTVGIGFYMDSRSMDNPFALVLTQTLYGSPGSPESSAGSARFELKSANASSKGQIIASGSNRSLGNGRIYVFTLDTNVSPAAVSISIE